MLALLRGIGLHSEEMALSEGVMLAPLGELDVLPPDPAWRRPDGPASVVALVPGRDPGSIEEALGCLRDLQTALRLYAPGISLSPLAWIRAQGSVWRALPIPGGGRSDGAVVVAPAQEDELRAFASLVTRRRPTEGELAWALERFELGLERDDALSGLTDHLLALRALLEPEGSRSGRLAGRIAALCAQPQDRIAATERVAHAISLEQSLIAGVNVGADALALAAEIEQHLRALLRDVICGHLAPDLVALADSLLVEHSEPAPAAAPTRGGPAAQLVRRARRRRRLLRHRGRADRARPRASLQVARDALEAAEVLELTHQLRDDQRLEVAERRAQPLEPGAVRRGPRLEVAHALADEGGQARAEQLLERRRRSVALGGVVDAVDDQRRRRKPGAAQLGGEGDRLLDRLVARRADQHEARRGVVQQRLDGGGARREALDHVADRREEGGDLAQDAGPGEAREHAEQRRGGAARQRARRGRPARAGRAARARRRSA